MCVSAIEPLFQAAGLQSLYDHGIPIARVIAPANIKCNRQSEGRRVACTTPVAFVEDCLPYLRGIPDFIYAAHVLLEPNGSPNTVDDLAWAHSQNTELPRA